MAGAGFHRQILDVQNSKEDLKLGDQDVKGIHPLTKDKTKTRRVSAHQLQENVLHGKAGKRNFTTIIPQGLPADLIGDDEEDAIERQNVLVEPKGYRHEGARLPPFKPFKTVSDEDNLHLLPGETRERARANLLDTKAATKKDVEQVRQALLKSKHRYPWLYNKNITPPPEVEETPAVKSAIARKTVEPHLNADGTYARPGQRGSVPGPPPGPMNQEIKISISASESSSTTSESSSSDEESSSASASASASQPGSGSYGGYSGAPGAGGPYELWNQYFKLMSMYHYAGIPTGCAPCCSPYPAGFNPFGLRHPRAIPSSSSASGSGSSYGSGSGKKHKKKCTGKPEPKPKPKKKFPKPQGLNFDFMPHDDLATEVTMTIEPDEPEPLQYAVENGIMPIICCYMPNSLAVSQICGQEDKKGSSVGSSSYGSGSGSGSYSASGSSGSSSSSSTKTKKEDEYGSSISSGSTQVASS